jgi:hypothetical protein
VLRDTTIVPRQVLLFRDFVRLIFTPVAWAEFWHGVRTALPSRIH